MSDPKPDRVMVDFMRIGFAVAFVLAVLVTGTGWWLVTFGEVVRIPAGSTMCVTGMGIFGASFIGHGVQLWTEK